MSKSATKEYTVLMRKRYAAMETKRAKGVVLDEFCKTTGLGRKHVNKVLRSTKEPLQAPGRKPVYADAEDAAGGARAAAEAFRAEICRLQAELGPDRAVV